MLSLRLDLAERADSRTIGGNSNEVIKIMAGKRKKHLRYQERKHGLASQSTQEVSVDSQAHSVPMKTSKRTASSTQATKKDSPVSRPELVSQLPAGEVAYVRRELRYIVLIAAVVAVLYTAIWFLLSRTTLEQRLFELLKIGS